MFFGGSVITEKLYIDVKQDLKKKKKKNQSWANWHVNHPSFHHLWFVKSETNGIRAVMF